MAGKAFGTPVQPGQVLNPTGINQYTYRADAEKHLAEWCAKHGQELIDRLLDDAKTGNGRMMQLALDRILPAVKEVDLRMPCADPSQLVLELAALAARRRTNGHDREAEPAGSNGTSGGDS